MSETQAVATTQTASGNMPQIIAEAQDENAVVANLTYGATELYAAIAGKALPSFVTKALGFMSAEGSEIMEEAAPRVKFNLAAVLGGSSLVLGGIGLVWMGAKTKTTTETASTSTGAVSAAS